MKFFKMRIVRSTGKRLECSMINGTDKPTDGLCSTAVPFLVVNVILRETAIFSQDLAS